MKYFIYFLFATLFFTQCKKQEAVQPVAMHYNYIPTKIGSWNTYEVISITHNTTGAHDTIYYYIKELIAEQIDSTHYRLERFWKTNWSDNWTIKDVWTREITSTFYNQTEENTTYTKLIFPVKEWVEWNGNAYNNLNEQIYSYSDVHTAYYINNLNFDSSVTIIQNDNTNAIEYQKAKEVYAKNIGMVYKSDINLNINLYDPTDINEGTELTMKIIEYGN